MAGDYGVPVNVHHDYSTTFGGELDTAVGSHPDTTFIWAHSGDTIPDNLRPYLEAHPNLLLDLSCRNDLEPFTTRPFELADQRLNEADGAIQERWRDLLEEHPDRFLFGSDIGPAGRLEIYGEILAYYRGIFAQLTPPTARMIAYENAQALFSTQ